MRDRAGCSLGASKAGSLYAGVVDIDVASHVLLPRLALLRGRAVGAHAAVACWGPGRPSSASKEPRSQTSASGTQEGRPGLHCKCCWLLLGDRKLGWWPPDTNCDFSTASSPITEFAEPESASSSDFWPAQGATPAALSTARGCLFQRISRPCHGNYFLRVSGASPSPRSVNKVGSIETTAAASCLGRGRPLRLHSLHSRAYLWSLQAPRRDAGRIAAAQQRGPASKQHAHAPGYQKAAVGLTLRCGGGDQRKRGRGRPGAAQPRLST